MIDWKRVTELREEIGNDDFEEVVDLFLEEVEEVLDRLSANAHPERLEDEFHFLKGCALNLGFRDFSNLCRDGEYAAASGAASGADIPAVLASFEQSKAVFLQNNQMAAASFPVDPGT